MPPKAAVVATNIEESYYRVPRRTWTDAVLAGFGGTAFSLIVIAFAFLIGYEFLAKRSVYLAFVVPIFSATLCIYWIWKYILIALTRDRITLQQDALVVGSGLGSVQVVYENLDLLEVVSSQSPPDSSHLRITFGRSRVSIDLSSLDADECVIRLRTKAPQAIYWDIYGNEHLPDERFSSIRTEITRERRAFRDATWLLIIGIPLTAMLVIIVVKIVQMWPNFPKNHLSHSQLLLALLYLMGPLLLYYSGIGFWSWRKLRSARLAKAITNPACMVRR